MNQLDGNAGLDRVLRRATSGPNSPATCAKQRPVTLAAGPNQVLGYLGEKLVGGRRDLHQTVLNVCMRSQTP